jgi:hypothetical protein
MIAFMKAYRAVEVLRFNDRTAGQPGPAALLMHNGGLFDE